jgi:hypothetical protein
MAQEAAPAFQILLLAFGYAERAVTLLLGSRSSHDLLKFTSPKMRASPAQIGQGEISDVLIARRKPARALSDFPYFWP